jgi:opacity protein-like surface antigen
MSAKWLAILVVLVAVLTSSAFAQIYERSVEQNNELSVTVGRTFVSTQTIRNSTAFNPHIHFGNEESVDFNYSRLLKSNPVFALYGELPVAIYPRMDLNTERNVIPKDIGALFVTPSARVNFFPGQGLSPWLSAGGGYGRFREASELNFFGSNPGPTGTNTGVIQFGAGLDVWPWRRWGVRLEARDFYSGLPALNVTTTNSRQHNYHVGIGVIRRF